MAVPTSLSVSVDSTEYSRYETAKNTITVTLAISGGAPYSSELVTVELRKARRSRDAVVATATVSFTGSTDPKEATATFYLPDIVDQDLISLIRHGKYFVYAVNADASHSAESAEFDIRIVTVERLKRDYLFGIPLKSTNVKLPKFDPVSITGITISEVSTNHPLGFATLSYGYTTDDTANATATIGSGGNGTVTITADQNGVTSGAAGNDLLVTVVVPGGTTPLSAVFAGDTLTVSLDVIAGVPNAIANTATLVAAAIAALPGFGAAASGTGATALSVASGPTQFLGGTTSIIRTLSWAGGPLVSIPAAGTYILRAGSTGPAKKLCPPGSDSASNEYIIVRVSSTLLLPTHSVAEDLLIATQELNDETLGRYLQQSIDWIEKDLLAIYLEPTNVVTDRDPTTIQFAAGINAPTPLFTDTDYDFIVSPLTYFVPRSTGAWVQIWTPYKQLLRVDSLFGSIANTRVIDIDLEWIEHSEQAGLIQLVPFNQEVAFNFLGLIWVNAIRGAAELPNFWHFNMIVGLRDASGDLQEVIAKKAAIDALTAASLAFRPGLGSLSLSRDGVSESTSFMASLQYGIYTGAINSYKEWLTENERKLRAKYRGLDWIVC